MAFANTQRRVLGVLAGADMPCGQLLAWARSAEFLIAADGGADRLLEVEIVPNATIGDLDSITPAGAKAQFKLISDDDQNTTDCDKLLALAESMEYRAITLAGVEGDLLDHVVGSLLSAAKSALLVQFALRRGVGMIVKGPLRVRVRARSESRLSVVPLTVCEGVDLGGTQWPLKGATLDPKGLTSLSNRAVSSEVSVSLRKGSAFVFTETDGAPSWDTFDVHELT